MREALTWVGTPYVQMGDTKQGAVDCSMLLVRCFVDTGVLAPFDPRPYPAMWHMHHDDERYLAFMDRLGTETARPQVGDIALYKFGRCFSHGGIIVRPGVLCSASAMHGACTLNDTSEAWLAWLNKRSVVPVPRPVRYYSVIR